MERMFQNWSGSIVINNKEYDSVEEAESVFKTFSDNIHIILKSNNKSVSNRTTMQNTDSQTEYQITVKQYMTRKATVEFDFMAKWNNDNPMPLRTMTGTIEKETAGMVYMNLHGQALETITCMRCGKELTHPISRHYGIGPECMKKVGMFCDITSVDEIKEKLIDVKWSGWVIRSSIIERKEV